MLESKHRGIRWKVILRNVIIVQSFFALGGAIVGFADAAAGYTGAHIEILAFSNILFGSLGFFICGCLTPKERWRYLSYTSVTVWISNFVLLPLQDVHINGTLLHIILGVILQLPMIFILMLGGGGISTLVVQEAVEAPKKFSKPQSKQGSDLKNLKWYEHAAAGWPLLLIIDGGFVAGCFGSLAYGLNGKVFNSNLSTLLKYICSTLIGVGAVFGYLFVLGLIELLSQELFG